MKTQKNQTMSIGQAEVWEDNPMLQEDYNRKEWNIIQQFFIPPMITFVATPFIYVMLIRELWFRITHSKDKYGKYYQGNDA